MPIYDYKCSTCGSVEENVVAQPDEATKTRTCKACGATAKRQFGAPSRILFRSKGGYLSTVAEH